MSRSKITQLGLSSLAVLLTAGCTNASDDPALIRQRHKMVTDQIEARGIDDLRLLDAMRSVPRHRFVPEEYRSKAYADHPLPIGEDQTISQPYIVAVMTQLLKLKGDEKVLEIGTGSGYQAAILAELAAEVFTIEIVEPLGHRAEQLLDSLGYDNVTVKVGDGYIGWVEHSPFDAIILTAAPSEIPQPLLDQLADPGRLVAPVGDQNQMLQLVEKKNGKLRYHEILRVRFVPMTGEAQER